MLSSDHNIETLSRLIVELKNHLDLREKSFRINLTLVLTRLVSIFIVALLILLVCAFVLFFVSMMVASLLAQQIGNEALSYAIVVCSYLLLGGIIYLKRKAWIESPIASILGKLLLGEKKESPRP